MPKRPTKPGKSAPTRTPARKPPGKRAAGAVTAVLPSGETLPVPWTPASESITAAHRTAVDKLFDAIPDDEMQAALELAAVDNKRVERFRQLQADPAYARHSIAARLRAADITPKTIVTALLDLHNADADLRVARRLPVIMEHMAAEAAPRTIACPQCSSDLGVARRVRSKLLNRKQKASAAGAATDDDCRVCGGIGQITVEADNEVRKMLLESAGKLGNRGPLIDARQLHVGAPGNVGAPDLTEFSRGSDDAFEEKGSWKRSTSTNTTEATEATEATIVDTAVAATEV